MSDVHIELSRSGEDLIQVQCEAQGLAGADEAPWATGEALGDLVQQVRGREAPAGAVREMSALLGRVLFYGDAGAVLREALATDPEAAVTLAGPPTLLSLPWEMATDPETGHQPAADGAIFVRLLGGPVSVEGAPRRGVITVPAATGAGRVEALTAVTRGVARKFEVDVFPAEPVTGLGLRRALATGALFVHFAGLCRDEALLLDDGKVPLERAGFSSRCWLAVLAGARPAVGAGPALRAAGVATALTFQRELQPSEIGAFNQVFYKQLAKGDSVARAAAAARARLLKSSGPEAGAWIAPVVWSGQDSEGNAVALAPFPPPAITAPAEPPLAPEPTRADIAPTVSPQRTTVDTEIEGHPFPAPTFIYDTLRLIQDTTTHGAEGGPDLDARIQAMRALGAGATTVAESEALSPAERTARLADALVDNISFDDLPLAPPANLKAQAVQLAELLGADDGQITLAAHALLGHRAVMLTGATAEIRRAVASGLASIFDRHALRDQAGRPLVTLQPSPGQGVHISGWAWQAVSMCWRRDELDPLHPGTPDPSRRVPVVIRDRGAEAGRYTVRRGLWAVVEEIQRVEDRGELYHAISGDALSAAAEGYDLRVPTSADFRWILTGASAPRDLPDGVPIVELALHPDAEVLTAAWARQVGVEITEGGEDHRAACFQLARQIIPRLRFGGEPLVQLVAQALALALWSDRPPAQALDESLAALIHGRDLPARARDAGLALLGRFDDLAARCRSEIVEQPRESEMRGFARWAAFGAMTRSLNGAEEATAAEEGAAYAALWWRRTPTREAQLERWRKALTEHGPLDLPLSVTALLA